MDQQFGNGNKFKNKYRIPSARLQNWDYGWDGYYYVTICTSNRECFFGEIVKGEMKLSGIGKLTTSMLLEIPKRYEYANLDEFIVMPNHIHVILKINKNNDGCVGGNNNNTRNDGDFDYRGCGCDCNCDCDCDCRDAINRVSTIHGVSTANKRNPGNILSEQNPKKSGGITENKNPMLHDNLSHVLNWFKGRVTFESRKINNLFTWQSRFHDRIIRNDQQYQRIKKTIINNPENWNNDSLNT